MKHPKPQQPGFKTPPEFMAAIRARYLAAIAQYTPADKTQPHSQPERDN